MTSNQVIDKPNEKCAVFGIYGHPQAALNTFYGLRALQHRGEEGCGIVTSDYDEYTKKSKFNVHKDFGLVDDVFMDKKILSTKLKGFSAIGHNRYSTAGSAKNYFNIQPLLLSYKKGNISIAHNGNLTNFQQLRKNLHEEGVFFQATSDTEVVLHLIARSQQNDQVKQVMDAIKYLEGAYTFAILTDDKLIAVRDSYGWRPLSVGRLDTAFVIASETYAFDIINAEYIRDVNPGELIVFDKESLKTGKEKSYSIDDNFKKSQCYCIFEYIYFSHPNSNIFGNNVGLVRQNLGKALAQEYPINMKDDDEKIVVINVPNSSTMATIGFVDENKRLRNDSKYEIEIFQSNNTGRTFIQPSQHERELKVKNKFKSIKGALNGRKVIVVDDSIVRGTTSKQLARDLKEAGAKEIHLRITSPPVRFPCKYGMDFPHPEELIANRLSCNYELIRKEIGVDTLGYLSLNKLLESVPHAHGESYCTACFTGEYPTIIKDNINKTQYDV